METVFKCPKCGRQAMGIVNNGCAPVCICPHCQETGTVIYMLEEKKEQICKMGDGFYTKKKV